MMPASNSGVGMNMGFPDVCNTIVGPATVPIPYPNMAMNSMAAPPCVKTLLTMMPALNMGTKIPMTSGMEAGTAHPMFKMMGGYTMGNPKILFECLPAIHMTCPTYGNNFNNPLGAVLVPSVTNTLLCHRETRPAAADALERAGALIEELSAAGIDSWRLPEGIAYLGLGGFDLVLAAKLLGEIERLRTSGVRSVVLDLRGNPGGELAAFLRAASGLLDAGRVLVREVDGDGDALAHRSRCEGLGDLALVLLVDHETASAAELLAACLQDHERAVLVGQPTAGKGTGQAVVAPQVTGAPTYDTCVRFLRPSGKAIDGVGVTPDVLVPAEDDALVTALELATRS